MAKTVLDQLLGCVEQSMHLHIFDGRYSDGIIAFLASSSEASSAIENQFTAGDSDWGEIRFGLGQIDWFPIVYVEHVTDAVPALLAKTEAILAKVVDVRQWALRVELVCNLVEYNKTHLLRSYAADLCSKSPDEQEDLLFNLRDYVTA